VSGPLLPFLAAWHFALGASVGSFLNVCIYRLPRGLPITGRSHCPTCGTTLRLADLVPLLSQLALKSRCRYCGARFSWRYFGIEALLGTVYAASFLFVAHTAGGDAALLAKLLIALTCLVGVIAVDLETYTIPDGFLVALAATGVGYDLALLALGSAAMPPIMVFGRVPVPQSILGALTGFAGLWLIGRLFSLVLRQEAMGFGDVKLTGAAGALLGPGLLLPAYFLLAVALGAVVGLVVVVWRRLTRRVDSEHRVARTRLPFGPFLAVALAMALLFPDALRAGLSRLYGL